ncbi:hypothetical protein ACKWTF_010175 [Chironomus riparius]
MMQCSSAEIASIMSKNLRLALFEMRLEVFVKKKLCDFKALNLSGLNDFQEVFEELKLKTNHLKISKQNKIILILSKIFIWKACSCLKQSNFETILGFV